MRVQEFIEYMSKHVNGTMKDAQIVALAQKKLEVKQYVSIKEKKELVDKIVEKCIYYENGVFSFDSIDCFLTFNMLTVAKYTNLEIEDLVECYDALCEAALMPVVIAAIGQEYNDVNTFLSMKRDDILENNALESQVGKFLENVLEVVDDFQKNAFGAIDKINIGQDAIANVMNMLVKQ